MDADLDTVATALYVCIDDLLISHPERAPWRPKVGIAPKLSDAGSGRRCGPITPAELGDVTIRHHRPRDTTHSHWPSCSAEPDERQAQGSHAAGRRERDPRAGPGTQQPVAGTVSRASSRGVLAGDHALAGGHTARRLTSPPFLAASHATRAGRRHGVIKLLRWLSTIPGESWQQRWGASGVEEHPGAAWMQLPLAWFEEIGASGPCDADELSSDLLMLICGDVIQPGSTNQRTPC